MWLCLNQGFLSAVQDSKNPGYLLVRARDKQHLDTYFPDHEKFSYKNSDYAWRIRISQEDFAEFVKQQALNIDYSNFKDSIPTKLKKLKEWFSEIWWVGYDYQEQNKTRNHL